jgi:hypothetical protein
MKCLLPDEMHHSDKRQERRYEVGLSELYFPDSYSFKDARGNKLDLRLECFNSVDGSNVRSSVAIGG